HPYRAGIAMLDDIAEIAEWNDAARGLAEPIIAAGGDVGADAELASALEQVNALGARLNERVRAEAAHWLAAGELVALVGGRHPPPHAAGEAGAPPHPPLRRLH